MTQEQLRKSIKQQLPVLPLGFEERNDALLNRLTTQEVTMKRKVSFALVLAMVLLVAALGIAVAAELGVFGQLQKGWFGKKMTRLEQVAEVYTSQIDVPEDDHGFSTVQFNLTQAHYDGETLYVGYRLTPGVPKTFVRDTVDVSSIAWDITPDDEGPLTDWENMLSPEDYALMQETLSEKDEVFLIVYEQFIGDGLYLADGQYVSPDEAEENPTDAGDRIGYKKLRLPSVVNNAVEVAFPLLRTIRYYYQNANGAYHKYERMEDQLHKVMINQNTESVDPTVYCTTIWGHDAQVNLWISDIDIHAQICLKLTEEEMQKWESQWDDPTIDALESFNLYADGEDVRVRATQCDGDDTYPLIMNIDYELPDSLSTLKLIPRYSLGGEHVEETLILK